MSEGKGTLLEKKKANGTTFSSNFILSQIFTSEWTLSLNRVGTSKEKAKKGGILSITDFILAVKR